MEIKIICLNLWNGGMILDRALDFLEKENADLLLLQEVYDGQDPTFEDRLKTVEVLNKRFTYPFSYFSPAFIDVLPVGDVTIGNLILSKFEIRSKETIFYDIPFGRCKDRKTIDFPFTPRNLQHVIIDAGGQLIAVFNTQGIWGTDGDDSDRRLSMSRSIISAVKDKEKVILAGDFNVSPNTKTIKNIEDHLKNVFINQLTTSFNMNRKTKPGYGRAVVDMIFVSKNIKIKSHSCPRVDVSDHLPLVAILEIG